MHIAHCCNLYSVNCVSSYLSGLPCPESEIKPTTTFGCSHLTRIADGQQDVVKNIIKEQTFILSPLFIKALYIMLHGAVSLYA